MVASKAKSAGKKVAPPKQTQYGPTKRPTVKGKGKYSSGANSSGND